MSVATLVRGKKRSWSALAAKFIIIGGIFAYLLVETLTDWRHVRDKIVGVDMTLVGAAVVLQVLSMLSLALLWRELMRTLGGPLGFGAAVRMQWLGTLGKYIPGKIVPTVGKIYLGGIEGVDRGIVALACGYEILYCFAGSALVFLMSVVFGTLGWMRAWAAPAGGFCVLVTVLVHPRIMVRVVNYVLRKVSYDEVRVAISYPKSLIFAVGYTLPYVLSGVSEFALLRAFHDVPVRYAIDMVGITTVATSLGFAALFAPGGLGVRDGLLTAGLRLLPSVSLRSAALVALANRVMSLVLDLGGGIVSLALYRGLPRKRGGSGSA